MNVNNVQGYNGQIQVRIIQRSAFSDLIPKICFSYGP